MQPGHMLADVSGSSRANDTKEQAEPHKRRRSEAAQARRKEKKLSKKTGLSAALPPTLMPQSAVSASAEQAGARLPLLVLLDLNGVLVHRPEKRHRQI